jgi:predicted nucleotidyltransferase
MTPSTPYAALAEKHGLVLLYLFGSQARGRATPESDWDFAALFDPDPSMDLLARAAALELDLVRLVRGRVDVTPLNDADPVLRLEVVARGRVVWARSERERVLFDAAAMREYRDSAHRRRVYAAATRRYFQPDPR